MVGRVELTRHLRPAAQDVFALAVTPEALPTWLLLIDEVKHATGPLTEEGVTFRGLLNLGSRRLDMIWRVAAVDPGRHIELQATSAEGGAVTLSMDFGAWYGACELRATLTYELPERFVRELVDRLWTEGVIRRDLRRSLENLDAVLVPT